MSKTKESGIRQRTDGYWEYRFTIVIDGKQVSRRKSTDEFGNKLRTKKEAVKAREVAIFNTRTERERKREISRRTFEEIYNEYSEKGRIGKAYTTILKQESLWKNHLLKRFGNRFIDDISVAEVEDYLSELYFIGGYSFKYVESFLKMFYLIFGQAYSRNYLDVDTYNKLCVNKGTKISMPKMKAEDDTEIIAFSKAEIQKLDDYFSGTNAETAYLLGRYCGLRINEAYGLKWENVDLESGTITINKQMMYQDGLIKLVPPKTLNATRTIYLCERLRQYLIKLAAERKHQAIYLALQRAQNQSFIEDIDGQIISSLELVNCLPNGKIQTVNSMKFHSRTIKERLNIDFKYHYLRHTYGTIMAELNTPAHLLCNQMGHGNINVTQRYYLAISKEGVDILKDNLNQL